MKKYIKMSITVEPAEAPMATGYSVPYMVFALSAVVLFLANWWITNRRIAIMGNKIPGPKALPFIGNGHLFLFRSNDGIMAKAVELSNNYGNTVRGWLGTKLLVFLTHPADVEVILNSHVHIDKSDEYRYFQPWFGDGLLISTGHHWATHRKLIVPAFHMNVLKTFVGIFNSNSESVVKKLRKEVGKVFDVHDYMSEATVDILLGE